MADMSSAWFVYILECSNGGLYTGLTNDLEKRFKAHCSGRGARYTRMNPPTAMIYCETLADRSSATIREAEIKRWPKSRKIRLIQ